MKSNLFVLALLVLSLFASSAFATQWAAHGVRVSTAANSSLIHVTPIQQDGFVSEQLCTDFIADQEGLALGKNPKGQPMATSVDLTCSVVKEAQAVN